MLLYTHDDRPFFTEKRSNARGFRLIIAMYDRHNRRFYGYVEDLDAAHARRVALRTEGHRTLISAVKHLMSLHRDWLKLTPHIDQDPASYPGI